MIKIDLTLFLLVAVLCGCGKPQNKTLDLASHFYDKELPFSETTMTTVQQIILLEETDAYRLSGKTGWPIRVEPQIGWFVGYLERDQKVYFFATHVEAHAPAQSMSQIGQQTTRAFLSEMGLLPTE